ncbi:DUF2807 domain-containing protein [Aggregatimonas sangjinii]|uniref:DUF2807 domain-containing protein n=1 Tax=Aggregatimonas sangjinii TaxID=2583587 RepID=A0A5B7SL40_9FLAO|nr:head GIN domain-containing protein [Aggregatimonas sangjinii]QCW98771.1 DUF2807 domain-containing protein [Aggregatimonas sangjinii]
MKNILAILFASVISYVGIAQKATTKELEPFTMVKAYDRIVVKLVKGTENKLVITGDDQDEINISNKDGLLKIKMEFDNFMDGDEAQGTLYYSEPLTLIDANENAKIISDETIKGERVEIKAQEGGKINLKIALDDVYVKSISGSEIILNGSSATQEVMVNTGGRVENEKLNTEKTKVVVNAGGRANVKASDHVEAKVRAGGYIYIHGNPKDVERDKVFGGKIVIVE